MTPAGEAAPPPQASAAVRWLRRAAPALAVACLGMVLVYALHGSDSDERGRWDYGGAYFDADLGRMQRLTEEPPTRLVGSLRHPYLKIFLQPLRQVAERLLDASEFESMRLLLAANAFIWTILLYFLARAMSGAAVPALALTLLGLSMAGATFWLPAPEHFAFGSTTTLIPLALLAFPPRRALASFMHGLGQLLAMGITVTNGAFGLIATFIALGRRRGSVVTLAVIAVFGASLLVRRDPETERDYGRRIKERTRQMFHLNLDRLNPHSPVQTVGAFFFTTLSPRVITFRILEPSETPNARFRPLLDTQPRPDGRCERIAPPSRTLQGAGYLIWTALLAGAAVVLIRGEWSTPLPRAILLCLAFQLALHLIYGAGVFLFSLHWTPLLVLALAPLMRTRWRPWALAGVVLLTLINGAVNIPMYRESTALLGERMPEFRSKYR